MAVPSPLLNCNIMYIDHELTKRIQTYLSEDKDKRDITEGATLLLKLSRNKILYTHVINRPEKFKDKLFYELEKYLKLRLNQDTLKEVVVMQEKVEKEVEPEFKREMGKRADHDQLPDAIQAAYTENATLMMQMRDLHTELRILSRPQYKPCDRHEKLTLLLELHDKYRANWEAYDNAVAGQKTTATAAAAEKSADTEEVHADAPAEEEQTESPAEEETEDVNAVKKINAARKYLSTNKKKLLALKNDESQKEKYETLLKSCQERVDVLLKYKQTVDKDLIACGLNVE